MDLLLARAHEQDRAVHLKFADFFLLIAVHEQVEYLEQVADCCVQLFAYDDACANYDQAVEKTGKTYLLDKKQFLRAPHPLEKLGYPYNCCMVTALQDCPTLMHYAIPNASM